MHNDDFSKLRDNKILKVHNIKIKSDTIRVEMTTSEFNRITTKPYFLTYQQLKVSLREGKVIE